MKTIKIVSIIGARPQFIKAVAIARAICWWYAEKRQPSIKKVWVHTGQHYDYEMSAVFFEELELPQPDYHLGVGSGTHGQQTGEMLRRIEVVLLREKPDWVLVYGDTNSTLAGALAAAKLGIPVGHVEAGLRSYNRAMPEEINRVVTDHIAQKLFCPSQQAVQNLAREGIQQGVYQTGDVMYDVFLLSRTRIDLSLLQRFDLMPHTYVLATIHRAENTDKPSRLHNIVTGLLRIVREGWPVVFPMHPRTRKAIERYAIQLTGVRVLPPVSYPTMLTLMAHAKVVLTDSGGVQKEAYWLQVPCVTLRAETEWVETVQSGWNVLVDADPQRIVHFGLQPPRGSCHLPLYGKGDAARQILACLLTKDGV